MLRLLNNGNGKLLMSHSDKIVKFKRRKGEMKYTKMVEMDGFEFGIFKVHREAQYRLNVFHEETNRSLNLSAWEDSFKDAVEILGIVIRKGFRINGLELEARPNFRIENEYSEEEYEELCLENEHRALKEWK